MEVFDLKKKKVDLLKIVSGIGLIFSIFYMVYVFFIAKDIINYMHVYIVACLLFGTMFSIFLSSFVRNKLFKGLGVLFVSSILVINVLVFEDILTLPKLITMSDFYNKSVNDVIKFTDKYKINLSQEYIYDEDIDKFNVVSQSVSHGKLIKDIKELKVYISNGVDPSKDVFIPNMIGWNVDDAVVNIKENGLSNTDVNFIINNEIERDEVFKQSVNGKIKRNDHLVLDVSLGSEDNLVPVEMKDLNGSLLFDAKLWLGRNGIKYEIVYEFSSTVLKGSVIGTDKEKGVSVDPKTDIIKVIVSKGAEIVVPDILNMSVNDVTKWIIENKLNLVFTEEYSADIEVGFIIRSNRNKGDKIGEDDTIEIVGSLGRLVMGKFSDLASFREWATKNGISIKEEYDFNDDVEQGGIIKFSHTDGAVVNITDEVIVYVSNGKAVVVPNFYKMSKGEIINKCNSSSLTCTFYYSNYSNSIARDQSMTQNKAAGSKVIKGSYVNIGLSSGPWPETSKPTPEKPKPTPTPEPVKTCNITFMSTWYGNDTNGSISSFRSKMAAAGCSTNNVSFITRPSNSRPDKFLHQDSSYQLNIPYTFSSDKNYTIIFVKN